MTQEKFQFYVYQLIDPRTNLPFYIGKGKGTRCYDHLKETYQNTENKRKYAFIKGLRNKGLEPIVEKILDNLDEGTAYYLEEVYIWKFGRISFDENGILTNICENNRPPNAKGRKLTEEQKLKLKGKKISDEHKKIISKIHKGKNVSKETRLKLSKKLTGQKLSIETRKKMSISKFGCGNNMFNKNHTIETKKKMRENHIKCDGEFNANAKIWKIQSPIGEKFILRGTLDKFCKEHNISTWTMANIAKTGVKVKKGNCVGWSCEYM